MLHPILDISNFNITLTFAGIYLLLFGLISLKIKQKWYIGEALPSFVAGTILGPFVSGLVDARKWSNDDEDGEIAYALTRLVIGIQMVKVGYELPKRYLRSRLRELTICLLPLMTIAWLATSGCIMLMIPNLTFLTSLIIGSCVICIDPVLSQAIAKGPFADNYVRRHLREFISAEAGGNDGFGFPFLLLSVSILRYDDAPNTDNVVVKRDWIGETDTGRFGGDVGRALVHWIVEGILYMIVLGSGYGLLVGFVGRKFLNLASKNRWIDKESFLVFPLAIGLFIVGTCGCFGSDETLACFIAGCALNWDGLYHSEAEARHDSFNSTIEMVLNFGTFIFIGISMPWDQMYMPHETGITPARLITLGVLLLLFRRIPAIMLGYHFIPKICSSWKEALFMGYFAPIGVGAISYVEYSRRLLPDPGKSDSEINHLTATMIPVVYWLVFFSIVIHGLSIPVLNCIYKWLRVPVIRDHPVEVILLSKNEPVPNNSVVDRPGHSIILNNRFSRISDHTDEVAEVIHGQDEPDTMMLRSNGQGNYAQSLERCSTKSSTRGEQVVVREVV
ncbi:Cation/H+ exchanger [Penicillium malachiteum]|uniref:Cation/H+ exchanger n=1 Tax=Penicillium malachiteum TaxID=1324776 RepID=UPI0025474D23|nr:Cation/H+ exchanger [Penicillium malachiteum]KAJ5715659.1 Cation/H+ exchanger [Penicillium malachiteum]